MKQIALILFAGMTFFAVAQESGRFYLEPEYQAKFSIGQPSYYYYSLPQGLDVTLPEVALYSYPVHSLGLSGFYRFGEHWAGGAGVALSYVKFEPVPRSLSYYDKVMIPLMVKVRYEGKLNDRSILFGEIEGGYQYTDNRWDYIHAIHRYNSA